MSLRLSVYNIGLASGVSRKIELVGARYRVHQSGALEIFNSANEPVLLLAHGVWTDVEVQSPC